MTKDVTIKEILEDKKYRKMSLEELTAALNWRLNSIDFVNLDGLYAIDKAKILMEKFKKEKEIIGYKLRPEFELGEFIQLTKNHFFNSKEFEEKGNLGDYNNLLTHVKKMGVLELWFTPVYKEDKFKDFEHTDERYVTYKGYDFEKSFITHQDFEYITSMNAKCEGVKFRFSKADISLIKEYVKEKL
jgi:hypothetical protein